MAVLSFALIAALALAGAFVLVALLPMRLRVQWAAPEGGASVALWLGPWRLTPRRRRRAPRRPGDGGQHGLGADWRWLLWQRLGRRVVVRRLWVEADVGTGDAAETALLYGSAWAIWSGALAVMDTLVHLSPGAARLSLRPDFQRARWRVGADCILAARAGQVMSAMLALGWTALRQGMARRHGA